MHGRYSWDGCAAARVKPPVSFEKLWEEKLADKDLTEATWAMLLDWLAAETKEGRWRVMGESSVCRPGISLYVFPFYPKGSSIGLPAIIKVRLKAIPFIFTGPEEFKVTPRGLEKVEIPQKDDDLASKQLTPGEVIKRRFQAEEDDDHPLEFFLFDINAVPAKE